MKIKVLTDIAIQTADNKPLKRAFEFYFKLKQINTDGYFCSTNYPATAEALQMSLPTFYSRIALLKQFNLSINAKKQFTLNSYRSVCETYSVRYHFHYTTHKDIQLILDALCIRAKKIAMQNAFNRKLNKYPAVRESLEQITGLESSHPNFREAVLSSLLKDHLNHPELSNSDLHTLNPDDNLNYATLSTIFGYSGYGSMKYKKAKMIKSNIAEVKSRQYRVNHRRYSSLIGNITYFRPDKCRVLTMPDNIIFANF